MDSVSKILTKKDYGFHNEHKAFSPENYFERPRWMQVAYVFLIYAAAMGEWKFINVLLYGIPKAITLGVIVIAFFSFLIYSDTDLVKKFIKPFLYFFLLLFSIGLVSFVIWIANFSTMASIMDGVSKILFQFISVVAAVSGVYLFGARSIILTFIAICLTNFSIMVLEIPNYGFGESMRSLWTCISTFGDTYGYSESLEIHELTFLFGMYIVYFTAFAPKTTKKERREKYFGLLFSIFFFAVGLKRIAIAAVIFAIIYAFFVKRSKHIARTVVITGSFWFVFFFAFLYLVRSGVVTSVMEKFGVDMMGRDYIWKMTEQFYELSPAYLGRGFEAVSTIVQNWYDSGLLEKAYPFHNDILKVFVELGFPGFCLWTGINYIVYPIFFNRYFDEMTGLLYMSTLFYMSFTYMTDNTAFYFWCTFGLRLIPLAYGFRKTGKVFVEKWKPPEKDSIQKQIKTLYYGE